MKHSKVKWIKDKLGLHKSQALKMEAQSENNQLFRNSLISMLEPESF